MEYMLRHITFHTYMIEPKPKLYFFLVSFASISPMSCLKYDDCSTSPSHVISLRTIMPYNANVQKRIQIETEQEKEEQEEYDDEERDNVNESDKREVNNDENEDFGGCPCHGGERKEDLMGAEACDDETRRYVASNHKKRSKKAEENSAPSIPRNSNECGETTRKIQSRFNQRSTRCIAKKMKLERKPARVILFFSFLLHCVMISCVCCIVWYTRSVVIVTACRNSLMTLFSLFAAAFTTKEFHELTASAF